MVIIPWCDDTLNGWVVCQVEEQAHILHTSILLEILLEEPEQLVRGDLSFEEILNLAVSMLTPMAAKTMAKLSL